MNKTLPVLLLATTLAACGGSSSVQRQALAVVTPTPETTSAAPRPVPLAHLVAPKPSAKAVVTPSPTPSPKAVAKTTSPRPKATATKAPVVAATVWANCTEMRKTYKGGVSLPGAVNKGGATQYAPHVSTSLYDANKGKDRDHDGIACEA